MSSVKNVFSIKDLENLSGIKAHTIRIWEKRYNILQPMRTDTNIRFYDIKSLQKLLNITLLHNHGYKISKISQFPEEKIPLLVRGIISDKSAKHHAINAFKMSMMNFDQVLFFNTYNTLLSEKSFREIFQDVFIPLINEIGVLWQTETITPAHEHFISCLIKQKLLINIEKLQSQEPKNTDKVFALYLPMNEIHELGLMYLNYEILLNGYKSIYLGACVPMESLRDIKKYFDNVIFVSYLTVQPDKEELNEYIRRLNNEIINDGTSEIWLSGRMTEHIDTALMNPKIAIIHSIADFIKKL